jgi:hypothetical protein
MLWKLPRTGSIITGAGWAGRGWVVEALEVLEIEFGVGGDRPAFETPPTLLSGPPDAKMGI